MSDSETQMWILKSEQLIERIQVGFYGIPMGILETGHIPNLNVDFRIYTGKCWASRVGPKWKCELVKGLIAIMQSL